MIRFYRLGYNPADCHEHPSAWGLPGEAGGAAIYLPRGGVIPCHAAQALWYVKIRRPAGTPKYIRVRGGSPVLFGADNLRGAEIALLVEGEFD